MKVLICIFSILFSIPSIFLGQEVTNIHFEQVGKQIHIFYDLQGDQDEYTIQVYCSTDNGQTWREPLKYVSGAVGEGQKQGNNKEIIWDVLKEMEKLTAEISFKIETNVINTGSFTDSRDGQIYKWVKIGDQVWMAENLNYLNGNSWCYKNKSKNCKAYGRLYDWHTATKTCPKGWHLPSDDEWKKLKMYLGMSQREVNREGSRGGNEGNIVKSTSNCFPAVREADVVGFTALPGGYRYTDGSFSELGYYGFWWSATEYDNNDTWGRFMDNYNTMVYRFNYGKFYGLSVRCVRD